MLVDHHCHLDFPDLAAIRGDVLARAKAAGVGLLVTVCTRVKRFGEVAAIADANLNVYWMSPPSISRALPSTRSVSPSARRGSTTITTPARVPRRCRASARTFPPPAPPACRW